MTYLFKKQRVNGTAPGTILGAVHILISYLYTSRKCKEIKF